MPGGRRGCASGAWQGDAEGLLTFVGRDDAMIKTAGNRVSPTEVEDAAVASGLIYEAVAFGVPDARLGAAIILIVRGKSGPEDADRSEEHTSELQSLMRISYAVFCLKKNNNQET